GLEAADSRLRDSATLAERVERFEREEILTALRVEQGCQRRAAERLGLSRRGLNKKLHRLGLLDELAGEDLPRFRSRPPGSASGSLLG
ncbi:MAG: hypothetical protein HKN12_04925, partial [Gemmatimonadetes bacterium]|nr:hypothetical protein [Gemmatimonadota bacterium]